MYIDHSLFLMFWNMTTQVWTHTFLFSSNSTALCSDVILHTVKSSSYYTAVVHACVQRLIQLSVHQADETGWTNCRNTLRWVTSMQWRCTFAKRHLITYTRLVTNSTFQSRKSSIWLAWAPRCIMLCSSPLPAVTGGKHWVWVFEQSGIRFLAAANMPICLSSNSTCSKHI